MGKVPHRAVAIIDMRTIGGLAMAVHAAGVAAHHGAEANRPSRTGQALHHRLGLAGVKRELVLV